MMKSTFGMIAVIAVICGVSAVNLSAQGALNLTATPLHLSTNGSLGVTFDIQTGAAPVTIYRIGVPASSATATVQTIWYNTTGIATSTSPTSNADYITTGWQLIGTATTATPYTAADVIVQCPLDVNITIPSNSRYGFAIYGNVRYYGLGTQMQAAPLSFSDSNITIYSYGWAGGSATAGPNAVGNWNRAFGGTVWYDIAQLTGTHATVDRVQVNNGALLKTGNNTVEAVIKNLGTTALDNQTINLEFSTDGGTTWSAPQPFSWPSFAPLADQTAVFTAPWNLPTVGSHELKVRINPPIGTATPEGSALYEPDADLTQVGGLGPNGSLSIGANTIQVEVTNNGTFDLNGVTIPMQYSRDNGTTWLPATPHPFVGGPALATTNGSQLFQFPGTESFSSGSATVLARIQPPLNGDPDTTDENSTVQLVGMQTLEVLATNPTTVSVTAGYPFVTNTYYACRSTYIYFASELTTAGLSAGDPISGMSVMTGNSVAFTADYADVYIGFKHTTDTVLVSANPHAQPTSTFQSVGGPLTIPAASITPATYIDFPFHTPFIWNGVDNICITIQNRTPTLAVGNMGITLCTGLSGIRTLRGYSNSTAVTYPMEQFSGYGTTTGQVAKIRLFTPVPSNQDIDIEEVSFGPTPATATGGVSLGNNTVHVTVKNAGIQAVTNTFGISYSTDDGTTWTPPQTVTPVGLAARHDTMTATFTAPWNLVTQTQAQIKVKIDPPLAGDPDPLDEETYNFSPDLDIELVSTNPPPTLTQPVSIQAHVRNNGNWSANGVQISLRYSINSSANWVTQTFTPGTLGGNGDTEVFTFTQSFSLPFGSNTTVDVEFSPQFAGDPDPTDAYNLLIPDQSILYPLQQADPVTYGLNSGGAANSNRGYMFLVNVAGKVVKRLGCFYPDGATQPKTLVLWRVTDPNAPTTVNATPMVQEATGVPTPGPGWIWYDLPTPVALVQGTYYVITGHSPTASYYYLSSTAINPIWTPTGDIQYIRMQYNSTSSTNPFLEPNTASLANAQYGVVDIGYGDANIPGNHIKADGARLGAGGAVVGANTVEAVLRNMGTTDHSNLPVTVKYSTDNGTTWSAPQTFTFPSFGPLSTVTASFTAPWNIPSMGSYDLMVEIDPPIGTAGATASAQIRPDPIIEDVNINAHPAQIGVPHIVQATVKNEGGFNLTGVPVGMRYRVNQGTWITENITPSNLPIGATQVLSFTQPVTFPAQGNYVLDVELDPLLTGDPGGSGKSGTRTFQDLGIIVVNAYPGNTGSNAIPFAGTGSWVAPYGYQQGYPPAELGGQPARISSFGFTFVPAMNNVTWQNYRIWMGESTLTTFTSNYWQNYNVAPPVLVHDGPITKNSPASTPARYPLQTPFIYSGQNPLIVTVEILSPGSVTGNNVRSGSGGAHGAFRMYGPIPATGIDANTTGGAVGTGFTVAASFGMSPPWDPGLEVVRGTNSVPPGSTDAVGPLNTANHNNTQTYNLINSGSAQVLNISSITVTDQSNCTAVVDGTPPSSVPFGGTPVPLNLTVNPSPGPYSYKITIVSNNADPSGSPYVINVSGTGFVNTAPTVSVLPLPPLQASGVSPNFTIEGVMGDSLAGAIVGDDVDGHQEVTVTITEGTGGTISAAAAGFTNTFPITVPAGSPPNAALMTGTAIAAGTVVFDVNVVDNGVFPLSHLATVTYRIGARVDVDTMNADSLFVRVSGVKDFYRGETGRPINMTMSNPNPFPVELQSMTFLPRVKGTQTILTGFTFNVTGTPLTIPANTTGMAVNATMDIAANAGGTNGVTVELVLDSAVAIDPANPTTNPIVVKILDPIDEFDLYDGPVPQPMLITMTAFQPAVETVSFLQDLTVSGGLGTYTWSIAPGSASGLPAGLTLNPNGNQFLAASIQGTPAAGSSNGSPYLITLRVSDGAYQADITLPMTVSPLLPLSLAPVTMPQGQEFVAYPGVTLSAAGGSQIYSYGVDFSSIDPLPAGLVLNPQTGQISGTPADQSQGTFTITFEVSDGIGAVTQTTSLTIIAHPLQWRSNTIASGEETVAYSEFLDAIGGTGPRIYSIVTGNLPSGLTLNPVSGEISGVPAQSTANSYPVTFRVTDGLNVTADETITLVIAVPPPLVITTTQLNYAQVGQSLSQTITASGGSRNYTFSVGTGTLAVPNSVVVNATGELSADPVRGDEGRFPLTIIVNDGFGTASATLDLTVLPEGADEVAITEVDVGTGYIELTNLSSDPVDVSGWSLMVWVDGTAPLAMAFDSMPGVSLSLPTEPITFAMGGTAGGFYPNYSTGTPWAATSSSDVAVALFDRFGNAIDFVRVGTVNVSGLQDGSANPVELPTFITDTPAIQNGAANHSLVSTGWSSGAAGSQGVYNSGLPAVPTVIVRENFHVAVEGEAYYDLALAIGGVRPYTWSLTAPSATWLSINPTTGELTGTPPASSAGSFTIDVTCTPTAGNPSSLTVPFTVVSSTTVADYSVTAGAGTGQSFAGTVLDIPVTFAKSGTAADVDEIGFMITLPAATAAQVDFHLVRRGSALTPAHDLLARDIGNNTIAVLISADGSNVIPAGEVAVLQVIVPPGGQDALEGMYAIEVSSVLAENATTKFLADAVDGTLEMSNYDLADVNRDGNINVVDVQLTVNIILSTFTPTYQGQGDVNGDGNINVVDVQLIVNCILNSASCP